MSGRTATPGHDRCRHCGRLDIDGCQPWCLLAPDEPLRDDPADDPGRTDAAEDQYYDERVGEACS